jgi:hypothetical protein
MQNNFYIIDLNPRVATSNVEEMMAVNDIDFNEIVVKDSKKAHSP